MTREGTLSEEGHRAFDDFLGGVLDEYKNGCINRARAVERIMHRVAALDIGNMTEVPS